MIKNYYRSWARAEHDAKLYNCDIACGTNNGRRDIYYLVPYDAKPGIYRVFARSTSQCRGWYHRVIYKYTDGSVEVIDKASHHRVEMVKAGRIPEDKIFDYLNGYYTLREERSEKIRQRKENARISHFLCDAPGQFGHEQRQIIRRMLENGELKY